MTANASIASVAASSRQLMLNADEPSTISLSYSELENETNNQNIIQEPASSVSIELKSDSNEIEMSSHSITDEAIAVDDECPSDIEAIEDPYKYYTHLTLVVRIKNHYSATYDYSKKPAHRLDNNWAYYDTHEWLERPDKLSYKLMTWKPKNITGGMLRLNEIPYLVIIDIDINHSDKEDERMPEEDAEMLREFIINVCKRKNFVLAQTPSGGFHIYANCDDKWIEFAKTLSSSENISRSCEFSIKKGLSLDIFTSMQVYDSEEYIVAGTFKVNNVLMVPSSIKYAGSDEIKTSKFIVGSYESVIDYDAETVLETFSWLEAIKTRSESRHESSSAAKTVSKSANASSASDYKLKPMTLTRDVQQALINGIDGISYIHTISSKPFKEEVSTLSLFPGLNALDEDLIEDAYNRVWPIYQRSNPKTHTMQQFMNQRSHHQQKQEANIRYLYNVIKNHNRKYFDEMIAPFMKKESTFEFNEINIKDEFTMDDFTINAKAGLYTSLDYAATDLSRVLRYHVQGNEYFLEKTLNTLTKTMEFTGVFASAERKKLSELSLFTVQENGKDVTYTALHAFNKHKDKLLFSGTTFNRDIKRCVKVWQGWKYEAAEKFNPDDSLFKDYCRLVTEGLCGYSPKGTDMFLHKCIAKILQNPGYKCRIAFVLQGIHRAGKGTWTDIICELTAGHSQPNINNVADIVGDFNKCIENKAIVVLNEQQDKNGKPTKIIGALKSKTTDPMTSVGDKHEPKRVVENVMNLIICTNATRGVGIEVTDPRYLVLEVCGKFLKSAFLRRLHNLPREFYENLMAYYMSLDVSNFEPEDEKPTTAAERDLKLASLTYAEEFIKEHYKYFSNSDLAFTEKTLEANFNCSRFKDYMKFTTFVVDIRAKCKRDGVGMIRVTRSNGKRDRVYLLKDEYLNPYKPTEDEIEKNDSENDDDNDNNTVADDDELDNLDSLSKEELIELIKSMKKKK